MKIGIVGTGMLGEAVGLNLLKRGHKVIVYNRTTKKTNKLKENGAIVVDTPCDVARDSEIVFTVVKDADAVEQVSFGNNGISDCQIEGLVVADMSTINPLRTKKIAQKFSEKDIIMLDTPVMGGPNVAIDGKLVLMASGDKEVFEKFRTVFETIGHKVFFLGEVGTAHSVKLAMNLQIAMLALALSEGITLTRSAKVDPEIFLEILNSTYFKTGMSEKKAYKMIKDVFEPTFTLANLKKDLSTINETAKSFGMSLPMGSQAEQVYCKALDNGFGDLDYTGILAYLKKSVNS